MKKLPVWKHIVLIIAVWVVVMVATFAWFVTGPRATVGDLSLNVGEASYIQISSDNGNSWSEDLDIEIGLNNNFKEISGNGASFFKPVYDVVEKPTGGYAAAIVAYEPVNDPACYYEQIFSFQADANYDVYLAPESYVTSVSEQGDSYIDGAIRVAFFELDENDNETLKCIWAPNSTVEYSADTDSFTNDGKAEAYYYYQKTVTPVDISTLAEDATSPHMAMIPTGNADDPDASSDCGYHAAYQFMWSSGENLPQNAPSLLTVKLNEGEGLGSKRMKIKVWLEGHDRECVSQLSGQKFTMKFQFNAAKENNNE